VSVAFRTGLDIQIVIEIIAEPQTDPVAFLSRSPRIVRTSVLKPTSSFKPLNLMLQPKPVIVLQDISG
jgi:hypothetical protein